MPSCALCQLPTSKVITRGPLQWPTWRLPTCLDCSFSCSQRSTRTTSVGRMSTRWCSARASETATISFVATRPMNSQRCAEPPSASSVQAWPADPCSLSAFSRFCKARWRHPTSGSTSRWTIRTQQPSQQAPLSCSSTRCRLWCFSRSLLCALWAALCLWLRPMTSRGRTTSLG